MWFALWYLIGLIFAPCIFLVNETFENSGLYQAKARFEIARDRIKCPTVQGLILTLIGALLGPVIIAGIILYMIVWAAITFFEWANESNFWNTRLCDLHVCFKVEKRANNTIRFK